MGCTYSLGERVVGLLGQDQYLDWDQGNLRTPYICPVWNVKCHPLEEKRQKQAQCLPQPMLAFCMPSFEPVA